MADNRGKLISSGINFFPLYSISYPLRRDPMTTVVILLFLQYIHHATPYHNTEQLIDWQICYSSMDRVIVLPCQKSQTERGPMSKSRDLQVILYTCSSSVRLSLSLNPNWIHLSTWRKGANDERDCCQIIHSTYNYHQLAKANQQLLPILLPFNHSHYIPSPDVLVYILCKTKFRPPTMSFVGSNTLTEFIVLSYTWCRLCVPEASQLPRQVV